MATRKFVLKDFIAAIRQNGYTQIRGDYILKEKGKVIGACAYGQAALNLHTLPDRLNRRFVDFPKSYDFGIARQNRPDVVSLNDNGYSLEQIANMLEKWAEKYNLMEEEF